MSCPILDVPFRRLLCGLSTTLALAACGTVPVAERALLDPPPANLTQLCPPPAQFRETEPVLMGMMAEADAELAFLYHECAARQHALVRWIAEAVKRLKRND